MIQSQVVPAPLHFCQVLLDPPVDAPPLGVDELELVAIAIVGEVASPQRRAGVFHSHSPLLVDEAAVLLQVPLPVVRDPPPPNVYGECLENSLMQRQDPT